MEAIRKIVRALRDSARTAQGETGITGAQLFVLRVLAAHPGLSINELAERTMTHQSSVSVVVSRLVARGLVARAPAADDRRRLVVELTPRGRLLHRKGPAMAQELLVTAVRKLGPERRRGLADGLEALTDALGASALRASMFFEDDERPESAKRLLRPRARRSTTREKRTSAVHA
ncbi:MAG TPA: MarR family transcriptional regulator [Polyangia bacterium]|nr:MarR family transcriptional regulator [Polyangia bacterium]